MPLCLHQIYGTVDVLKIAELVQTLNQLLLVDLASAKGIDLSNCILDFFLELLEEDGLALVLQRWG